jgi:hypothetical protein
VLVTCCIGWALLGVAFGMIPCISFFFFFSVALGLDMRVLADIHYIASRIYSISIMLVSKMFKQLYNNHGRLTFPQFSRHV